MGEAAVIWGRLTEAFWLNCQLFGLTLLFALPLGLVVSFGSMSRLAPPSGSFSRPFTAEKYSKGEYSPSIIFTGYLKFISEIKRFSSFNLC